MGRQSWERRDVDRDVELLVWVSRFRFVTAEVIGLRFGVSVQRARARLRRLERIGLLGAHRDHVSQSRVFWLTGKGALLIGQPRRRAPQPGQAREHELAIATLAARVELAHDDIEVLTERQCRARERARTPGGRYSVDVYGAGARDDRRRWPDLVLERDGVRQAVEIEFAPKHTKRLRSIVNAYSSSSYQRVVFFVRDVALAKRLVALRPSHELLPPGLQALASRCTAIVVSAWIDIDPATRATIERLADASVSV